MARNKITAKSFDLKFTGESQYQPQAGEKDPDTGEILYPYLVEISPGLKEAVDLAIKLNRPLLLEGEPGCGKTKLAQAVAYEFTKRSGVKYPYAAWYIKSTEQARDGLYLYDAVRRLYDAQFATIDPLEQDKIRQRLNDPEHEAYITWGAIGKAFRASQENQQRMIVLIDEIDKADTDFPNDLLLELEEKFFVVKETGKEIHANPDFSPIIFITSNAQKKLPDAFLRRCLYHYIEFPGKQDLQKIVVERFGKKWRDDLTNLALDRFLAIREAMDTERGDFGKKVSISELLDWFNALHLEQSTAQIRKLLKQRQIPYASTLLKTKEDLEFAEEMAEEAEDSD